ncbi:8-oxo-dGTP pyrophosphatase MutT (NUDIX family) [Pseudoclavibacter chungangensis]|uniref:NUDIX hydrolase n=1 Tax=Pseudoclavibacter chungangensis TaxID=587635 RepID=UPI0015CABFB7|nr:NUDIX domain-containing protein [Pseudoclavibacter chungangensis]NYJ68555.1 8-oxo-dGTP pyrophosphatase MutT (NUDIX family) [Pseudoclavibacter chungangensis]
MTANTPSVDTTAPIRVSAVVLRDARGRIVTVRKRGTSRFQLPGGKPEAGESAADAAVRECAEETGVALEPAALVPLGRFSAPAANEAGRDVQGDVFASTEPGAAERVSALAEIEEVRLLDPSLPLPDDLAPLLRDHVLPALRALDAS